MFDKKRKTSIGIADRDKKNPTNLKRYSERHNADVCPLSTKEHKEREKKKRLPRQLLSHVSFTPLQDPKGENRV
jgi:hypothetical protein